MNMMKFNAFLCSLAAGLGLLAVSCAKSDEYEKGAETPAGCISAYFSSSNKSSFVITSEEYAQSDILPLDVERAVSDATADVPIVVVRADSEFEIPATVHFEAGESNATLNVKMNGLKEKTDYSFTIRIADEYADHYTIRDGSDVYTANVLIAKWVKVVEDGTFYFENEYFPTVYSDIYHLDGYNQFYIENFLGSGIDLGFSIKSYDSVNGAFIPFSADDKSTWAGKFVPLDHFLNDPDGGSYWWLMNDAVNQDYASWTPEGWTRSIDYINFYTSDDTTYEYIDLNGSTTSQTGYLCSYTYMSDDNNPGYVYVYFYWNNMVEEN